MAVTPFIRGRQGTANGGLMTINADIPMDSTAPVAGDWMLVVINTTAANPTITGPNGWAQVMAPVAMGSRYMSVWRGIRGASDGMLISYMFMQSAVGAAQALLVYGPGEFSFLGTYSKGASALTQTTPGVATTLTNSLALSLQAEATSATEVDSDITVASPFIKDLWTIQSGSPLNSILLSHRAMPTPGNTGDAVSTWKNPTGNRGSVMAVIVPAPDASVTRLDARMADGKGGIVDVGLVGWDGTKEVALAKWEYVYPGTFVPDLDRITRVWTMAHRGGSADYQEHSARGYVQSAIARVDVLEFSVGITSDGVFFGLHDATLNRTTSGLAANYLATEHTWAEISALVQDLPNRGDSRFTTAPYLKLDDFINQWAPSHTLMFDPKLLSTANRVKLYDRLKQVPDYQNRILGKYYTTGTVIADEFHAAGMKVWGYSYTADVDSGATAATAAKWDYLGLEYTASQATWDTMLQIAGPKKVLAHIVPTAATAQAAVAKGARALQVSGVNSVAGVY